MSERTKKKVGKKGKGSSFERQVCKDLSLWWSKGKTDDIFWRTAGSGARATQRRKKNLKTFGQCGDLQATDPIGQPLLDLISFELKRGYKDATIHSLLDRLDGAKMQTFEGFIQQARADAVDANAAYWAVVSRRDRREALITMPNKLSKLLPELRVQADKKAVLCFCASNGIRFRVFVTTLDDFFEHVRPKRILCLAKELKI